MARATPWQGQPVIPNRTRWSVEKLAWGSGMLGAENSWRVLPQFFCCMDLARLFGLPI